MNDLVMKKFEPLKQMDEFSEELFNRIISFQEKEHPAWNTAKPFAERIKDLSLHYLVFSNPDRDPEKNGPTVAPYYPLREEMQRIAHYACQVSDHNGQPVMYDIHGGNGFIGSLIGNEGVQVIGLQDRAVKPNQIQDFYDPSCYQRSKMSLDDLEFSADMVFSSWMPSGINATPGILRHKPKLIVFVHTDYIDEKSGKRQTGTEDAFVDLPGDYRLIDEWSIVRPENIFHEIWPDLTASLEETRQVKIYAGKGFHDIAPSGRVTPKRSYDWELELAMATLALEAKQQLREQGFEV